MGPVPGGLARDPAVGLRIHIVFRLPERSRLRLCQQSVSTAPSPRYAPHRVASATLPGELRRCGAGHGAGGRRVGAALASHGRSRWFEPNHAHPDGRAGQRLGAHASSGSVNGQSGMGPHWGHFSLVLPHLRIQSSGADVAGALFSLTRIVVVLRRRGRRLRCFPCGRSTQVVLDRTARRCGTLTDAWLCP